VIGGTSYGILSHGEGRNTMYRIYTEDANRSDVYAILDSHVSGYTIIEAIGSWKGQREASLVIELIDVPASTVTAIARTIRAHNKQESVLVVDVPESHVFITD
jgi:uncharacterized membrane-anchored protein YitT (DUF2179 family)